uniref:G-protein coupled receptors family 1 profile domain-containing protein n=1 Tax=Panagrolaimus sp. JU765 TaxID=591449 RepID=A0AC34Q2D9_9BILA
MSSEMLEEKKGPCLLSFIIKIYPILDITPRLNRNLALRLLFSLCVTDFLFAFSTLPYIIYYAKLWNPYLLDYDPMYIVTSSTPLVIQFKINLLITIMIAVDRLQAMKLPIYYRRKNQTKFVIFTIGFGVGLGIIDLIFEYSSTIFDVRRYNCAAIGCFQEPQFRAYWGISNMALNTLALICTLWVAWEIYQMSKKSDMTKGFNNKETNNLNQANRLSFGILMISFLFLMIPSTFVGVVELTGLPVFKIIGPFYIIGLLLAGVSNSIVYITLHVEIRQAAAYLVIKKTFNKKMISTSTTKFGGTVLLAFAHEGANVVLHGTNSERLKATEGLLKDNGITEEKYLVIEGEIQNELVQDKIISETVAKFGKIDVLINNAGVGIKTGADPLSMENFDYVMNINYRAPFRLTQLALPYLEQTKGNVINTSSVCSYSKLVSNPLTTVYGSSKAALDTWVRYDSQRLAERGVRINTINPGPFHTNIFNRSIAENVPKEQRETDIKSFEDSVVEVTPVQRWGKLTELVPAYLLLADNEASGFTIGASWIIDG